MICGHCKGRDASIEHVRQCSTQAQRTATAVQAATGLVQRAYPRDVLAYDTSDHSGVYIACDPDDDDARVSYYKVQNSTTSGKPYVKRFDEDGEWVYEGRRPLYFITKGDQVNAADAKRFGEVYGCCLFCMRTLTDERSIEVGYGPTCAAKNGLPWG